MSDLVSAFTTPRARPDATTPAPERRAVDASGTDFARSLASVRGLERSAAGQDRAAQARAAVRGDSRSDDRGSERSDVRAADQSSLARSRAQVQSLMLSGAMKFAATRGTDATPAVTIAATAEPRTQPIAQSMTQPMHGVALQAGDAIVADAPASLLAVTVPAVVTPQTFDITDAAPMLAASPVDAAVADNEAVLADALIVDATVLPIGGNGAATIAAMQLVASLPLADAPVADAPTADDVALASGDNDDAARAAWSRRQAGLPETRQEPLLAEDHFDAPAFATSGIPAAPVPATRTGSTATTVTAATSTTVPTLRDAVPAGASVTFVEAPSRSTAEAASAASTTPTPASATTPIKVPHDVRAVERSVSQLAPEFRERLQRVMERMKQEFGHEITVVETVRSTARQAALFAQGRTAPGPVVTWTRNSKHAKGLAADLMVDGQWENPVGYAHLAQVAKEEGLRTLGARDPGHVELTGDGQVSAETLGTLLGDLGGDAGDGARKARAELDSTAREDTAAAMARVANVAQVARVSTVAQVARVATVARPGAAPARAEAGTADAASPLAVSGPMPRFMADGVNGTTLAAPVNTVNMADRISQLMDIQSAQSARPLNSVLLRMDNANGIEDQIRIDTRGTSVDAQLGLGTAQQAAELSGRVSELREALERRGLTADGLRVQAAPRATDSVQFSRTAPPALEMAALRAAAESQAQGNMRDQASRDQQQREAMAREQERPTPRPSSDDARHRSRREQPETRQ